MSDGRKKLLMPNHEMRRAKNARSEAAAAAAEEENAGGWMHRCTVMHESGAQVRPRLTSTVSTPGPG